MSDQKIITVNKTALKDKWTANKGKILGTALVVTAAFAAIEYRALQQHNEFLKEHDLYDEYYSLDDVIDPEAE